MLQFKKGNRNKKVSSTKTEEIYAQIRNQRQLSGINEVSMEMFGNIFVIRERLKVMRTRD